jgi:hypothetical protein
MKTIIAGSRSIRDYELLEEVVRISGIDVTEVVSGGARGVDTLAIQYATLKELSIHLIKPNWKEYGNAAGMIRNTEMVNNAEALIALWDGESKGTQDVIQKATKKGLKIYVYNLANCIHEKAVDVDFEDEEAEFNFYNNNNEEYEDLDNIEIADFNARIDVADVASRLDGTPIGLINKKRNGGTHYESE